MLDYFAIINKYYQPGTRTYKIFTVHAILVTNKALKIARRLNLSAQEQEFIEEAAMLHDIGVFKVNSAKMDCVGDLPYIAHGVAGAEILRQENLPQHAQVAERHVGVGLTKKEISARQLPLPTQDFLPETQAEKIITYADLFFSKREATLWKEDTPEEIEAELNGFGPEQTATFRAWRTEFGE
ncbi:MAG: HDIG domain-containing protein [bacterium]|nr:HDIG domain-containing protein [bacterium]